MQLLQPLANLLVAAWEIDEARLANALPPPLEPLADDGRSALLLTSFRNRLGRLGLVPTPPYAEVDVRTAVRHPNRMTGVFVFAFHTTGLGLAARAFGIPVERTRIDCGEGHLDARGLDVYARYRVGPRAGELGALEPHLQEHELAFWEHGGTLRRMAGGYHRTLWHEAELIGDARFGPLASFEIDQPPSRVLYSPDAELRAHLPARALPG